MDIFYIRENADKAKENQKKRFLDETVIDEILKYDSDWRKICHERKMIQQLKTKIQKSFRTAPDASEEDELIDITDEKLFNLTFESKLDIGKLTKNHLRSLSKYCDNLVSIHNSSIGQLLVERDGRIDELGNLLSDNCFISQDEDENPVVTTVNHKFNDYLDSKNELFDHTDLVDKLGLVDTTLGLKIAGNRGYFLTNYGLKLNMALMNYAIDFLMQKGYSTMSTPHFVNGELMGKVAQLSDYEETLYKIQDHDKYLIATSEQSITASFEGTYLNKKDLPIKIGGHSTCYRKEAGRGKNKKGIYRVHQFEKVEQFRLTEPDKSWEAFDEMMNICKEFYDSLGISYRIVNIVSGALNNSASMKYDLEAYFPGSKLYCELVSCTNCLDYFSKRIGTTFGNKEYVHMLNCTLCANTRTICCILETYQTDKGVVVPEVLRPYMGNLDFINFEEKDIVKNLKIKQ